MCIQSFTWNQYITLQQYFVSFLKENFREKSPPLPAQRAKTEHDEAIMVSHVFIIESYLKKKATVP